LAILGYVLFADWLCVIGLLFANMMHDCCCGFADFELEGFAG